MEYIIDIGSVTSSDELHDALEEALPLPYWYGRNLDALYDILTALPASFEEEDDLLLPEEGELADEIEFRFVFVNSEAALQGAAGGYIRRLIDMCQMVELQEPAVFFHWL